MNARAPGSSRPAPAGARLVGTGMALPEKELTNADLERMVETSDQWIVQRTGIRRRRVAENGTTTTQLGVQSLDQALRNAGVEPAELDLLICATMTQDMICPATAAQMVAEIGAVPCGAMDIGVACTGFVAGLNMAANFLASGAYRNVAVVGAEVLSRIINWEDRNTCVLFGDGAAAAIVRASEDPQQGCLHQTLASDGTRWMDLYCPRTPADVPQDAPFSGKYETLQMNGREVYKFAVNTLQQTVAQAMEACELGPEQVKMVIPHQSNARIIDSAREKLGLGEEKVYLNLDRYGNTSAASVGLCLHELMDQGRIEQGDHVIFVALGGGLTWASSVWRM